MRIGIDFDNTIVRYDGLFHRLAVERGLIPQELPRTKRHVRDHLRNIGREDDWTGLQAEAYGPRLIDAEPFEGVLDFLRACRAGGVEVTIISHKTRYPYRGPRYDLHEAAGQWLNAQGFLKSAHTGLTPRRVYFEPTLEAKLARIAACRCTHFIDDLPEFLAEAGFPPGVERILFDPHDLYEKSCPWRRMASFGEMVRMLEVALP